VTSGLVPITGRRRGRAKPPDQDGRGQQRAGSWLRRRLPSPLLPKAPPDPRAEQPEGLGGCPAWGAARPGGLPGVGGRLCWGGQVGEHAPAVGCCCPPGQRVARAVRDGLRLACTRRLSKRSLITKCADADCSEGWRGFAFSSGELSHFKNKYQVSVLNYFSFHNSIRRV